MQLAVRSNELINWLIAIIVTDYELQCDMGLSVAGINIDYKIRISDNNSIA